MIDVGINNVSDVTGVTATITTAATSATLTRNSAAVNSDLTFTDARQNAGASDAAISVTIVNDGTASQTLSVGVSGTASKYMGTSDVDLKTTGIYEVDPGVTANGSTEALIATYAADSSSAGAARIIIAYSIPS